MLAQHPLHHDCLREFDPSRRQHPKARAVDAQLLPELNTMAKCFSTSITAALLHHAEQIEVARWF